MIQTARSIRARRYRADRHSARRCNPIADACLMAPRARLPQQQRCCYGRVHPRHLRPPRGRTAVAHKDEPIESRRYTFASTAAAGSAAACSCETHVAGGVSYMRWRAYGRRERDTSAPILCLWHGPIWSVLLGPVSLTPAAASTPPGGGWLAAGFETPCNDRLAAVPECRVSLCAPRKRCRSCRSVRHLLLAGSLQVSR